MGGTPAATPKGSPKKSRVKPSTKRAATTATTEQTLQSTRERKTEREKSNRKANKKTVDTKTRDEERKPKDKKKEEEKRLYHEGLGPLLRSIVSKTPDQLAVVRLLGKGRGLRSSRPSASRGSSGPARSRPSTASAPRRATPARTATRSSVAEECLDGMQMCLKLMQMHEDLPCCETNRVPVGKKGYIHANFVTITKEKPEKKTVREQKDGKDKKKDKEKEKEKLPVHIVTQAPLESTAHDFWEMVLHNKVKWLLIVCCMKKDPDPRNQCQFWPLVVGEPISFGDIALLATKAEMDTRYDAISTYISITNVRLIHWPHIPKGGSPQLNEVIDYFHKGITEKKTVLVSTEGVGRAGAIDLFIYAVETLPSPQSMEDALKALNRQRFGAVKNSRQYVWASWSVACFLRTRMGDAFKEHEKAFVTFDQLAKDFVTAGPTIMME